MMDPVSCDRCSSSLEYGWSQRYRDDQLLESICFTCDETDQISKYREKKIISSKLMTTASIKGVQIEYSRVPGSRSYGRSPEIYDDIYLEINQSVARIHAEVKNFERVVWFGGLQKQVVGSNWRGFRMDFGKSLALVYTLAGRTQITIETENEDSYVSVITAEDSHEPVMGIQGINATEKQALQLLVSCKANYLKGNLFQQDSKVGLPY